MRRPASYRLNFNILLLPSQRPMTNPFFHRSFICRTLSTLVAMASLAVLVELASAQLGPRLLSRDDIARLGLERSWFTQVALDPSRNSVERAILAGDSVVVLTTAGTVQALDANSGESMWSATAGDSNYPSLGPAASDNHIAIVNGSTLYVLDRKDGKPKMVRQVGGAPGASPALTDSFAFVPLVRGRIEGYPFDKAVLTPWVYQSAGRTMVPPVATAELLIWTTDRGNLYVADAVQPRMKFRVETSSEFIAPPAYAKPNIYAANIAGEIFAIDEATGTRRWKNATGYPVTRAPAIVDKRLFITNAKPNLVAIEAETGAELWSAPGVTEFAAVSRQRVYGIDDLGALVVFDAQSGAPLGRVATNGHTRALVNDQTDRLILVTDDGLIQCLHEIGMNEPLRHGQPAPAAEGAVAQPATSPSEPAPPKERPQPAPAQPAPSRPADGEQDLEAAEVEAPDQPAPPSSAEPAPSDDSDPFDFE